MRHRLRRAAVQEDFAVAVLPGRRWPGRINDDDARLEKSFVVPDAAPADVRAAVAAAAHASADGEDRAEPLGRSRGRNRTLHSLRSHAS